MSEQIRAGGDKRAVQDSRGMGVGLELGSGTGSSKRAHSNASLVDIL